MSSVTLRFLAPALMLIFMTHFAPALDLLESIFYTAEIEAGAWMTTIERKFVVGAALIVAFAICCTGLHQWLMQLGFPYTPAG